MWMMQYWAPPGVGRVGLDGGQEKLLGGLQALLVGHLPFAQGLHIRSLICTT
jgi:hypothetical protein